MLRIKKTESYFVPIVLKTLDVIELLASENEALKTVHVARSLDISLTTTYRILRSLLQRGYVTQDSEGRYALAANALAKLETPLRPDRNGHAYERRNIEELSREQIISMLELITGHLSRTLQSEATDRARVNGPPTARSAQ